MRKYKTKLTEAIVPGKKVVIGMQGSDYNDEVGVVLAVGSYSSLKKYDDNPEDTYEIFGDLITKLPFVLVANKYRDVILYAYEESGFLCYSSEFNNAVSKAKLSSKYQR